MPKTKRDILRRTLAQGMVNLNWAGMYFQQVAEEFRPHHPELAEGLDLASEGLVEVEKILQAFCGIAWNHPDPNWVSWAGTNRPRAGDLFPYNDDMTSESSMIPDDDDPQNPA